MKCKNCSHEFDGRYCNACGQEIAGRINLKHIWTQIADDIFNIDKGLIYTIKSLWINPGKTAADYIDGKRKNYYGPVKYLILWTAIFFIISPFVAAGPQGNSITQLHCSPFKEVCLVDKILGVGHEEHFYLFDLETKTRIVSIKIEGYLVMYILMTNCFMWLEQVNFIASTSGEK